jgi:hypothetical protein
VSTSAVASLRLARVALGRPKLLFWSVCELLCETSIDGCTVQLTRILASIISSLFPPIVPRIIPLRTCLIVRVTYRRQLANPVSPATATHLACSLVGRMRTYRAEFVKGMSRHN